MSRDNHTASGNVKGTPKRYFFGHHSAHKHVTVDWTPPNPSGLCKCGCGQTTPISRFTRRGRRYIEGEHLEFVRGHGHRVPPSKLGDSKWCGGCLQEKPRTDFSKNKSTSDGLNTRCRGCRTADKRVLSENAARVEDIAKEQAGVCAICLQPETARTLKGERKSLSIDHDHVTREIRGLLCSRCNLAVGLLRDDPALLRRAAEYIENCPSV